MSIEAVIGRIDQILQMQQQLLDPAGGGAAAGASTATTSVTAPLAAADAGGSSFSGSLAAAQTGAASAAAGASGYVNPLAGASVRAERIDQGVDYAGSGTVGALGPGVVTQVVGHFP